MDLPTFFTFFSALSFLGYGVSCLTTQHMKREFQRFGYPRQRILTGSLQLLGAVGLLIGQVWLPILAFAAALGLTLMMAFGFYVRWRIKDPFIVSSPALIYALMNLYLSFHYGHIVFL